MPRGPLSEAIGLDTRDVVAIVGGGGKTTALLRLGRECAAEGERVVLTTTTKIEPRPELRTERVQSPAGFEALGPPWPVLIVTEDLGNRWRGVPPDWVDGLAARGYRVIAQADGSGRRPFKAPAEHEPAIPPSTTLVLCLVGIDVLGVSLVEEHVHRAARVSALAGLALGEAVTEEAVARVLLHPDGGGKGLPAGARRVVIVNKVETGPEREAARRIALRLQEAGLTAVIGSLRDGWVERVC